MSEVSKTKISDLQEVYDARGLYTLLTDANNNSKKFALGGMQETLANHEERITALESNQSFLSDLENVIYAHGGNDNDPTKDIPALLRGEIFERIKYVDGEGQIVANRYGVPRIILYYKGLLYDNAPEDFQGGETINQTYTSTFHFRLCPDVLSPYSYNNITCRYIECVTDPVSVAIDADNTFGIDRIGRRIVTPNTTTPNVYSIGTATVGSTNTVWSIYARETIQNSSSGTPVIAQASNPFGQDVLYLLG